MTKELVDLATDQVNKANAAIEHYRIMLVRYAKLVKVVRSSPPKDNLERELDRVTDLLLALLGEPTDAATTAEPVILPLPNKAATGMPRPSVLARHSFAAGGSVQWYEDPEAAFSREVL